MRAYRVSEQEVDRVIASLKRDFSKLSVKQEAGFRYILSSKTIDGALVNQLAYMLATTWHETARTMQPIAEYGSKRYIQSRYDPVLASTTWRRRRASRMGNTKRGDGWKYRGRGYVQLTWYTNYAKMSPVVNEDLVNNPDLVMEPKHALKIMVTGMAKGSFTGAKLSRYVNETKSDYYNARRVINGTDKARTIAGYATTIERCLIGRQWRL